jgi:hypothetical protein
MTTATQTSTQTSTGTVGTIRPTTGVRIAGLPAEVLDIVRSGGMDASGNPPVRVVAEGGEPVRCCLRDAREGEELVLFGYAPRLPASPYRETGAVFAHARTCPAPPAPGYPREWLGRPQVLRAYDARGWIHPATRTHDGTDPEGALAQVLAEPGVVQVHSRNVAYGCWMFTAVPA